MTFLDLLPTCTMKPESVGGGCRGTGPRYDAFCEWLNEQARSGKLDEKQTDDWPWYYWGFNDPALDEYMRTAYKDDIFDE